MRTSEYYNTISWKAVNPWSNTMPIDWDIFDSSTGAIAATIEALGKNHHINILIGGMTQKT